MKKIVILFVVIMAVVVMGASVTTAHAKAVNKIHLTVGGKSCKKIKIAGMKKKSKVKIGISQKSVVRAKQIRKTNRIKLVAKKKGKAKLTLIFWKKGKKCKLTYSVLVKNKKSSIKINKKMTDKELAKKAFKIQNKYRKEAGVKELEWSEELYEFCLFRIKNSGYDAHKNLNKDARDYFGLFAVYKTTLFGENMAWSSDESSEKIMDIWKKSKGHRKNYLDSKHTCGAIAKVGDIWLAIFWDKEKEDFVHWRDYKLKMYTIKRYDKQSQQYVGNVNIAYYDVNDRNNSDSVKVGDDKYKNIVLEIGKTYRFYERKSGGYEKANPITITVTENDEEEIILTN